MDPFLGLIALYALSKSGGRNPELVAYAVPSKGLGVVMKQDGGRLVLGNGFAYVTDWTGRKLGAVLYGDRAKAQESVPWMDDASLGHEVMQARRVTLATGFGYVIKYKATVWVVSPPGDIIATVDKGHFLGQVLTGSSKEAASALITEVLKAGVNLDPVTGAVVGAATHHAVHHHARHMPHVPHGYHRAHRVIHLATFR
jgi:hypothetical protein